MLNMQSELKDININPIEPRRSRSNAFHMEQNDELLLDVIFFY